MIPEVLESKKSWAMVVGGVASKDGTLRSLLETGLEDPNLLSPNGIGILTIQKLLAQETGMVGDEPTLSPRSYAVDVAGDGRGMDPLDEGVGSKRRETREIDGGVRSEENKIEGYSFSQSCTNMERYLDIESEDLMNVAEDKKFQIMKQEVRTPSPIQGADANFSPSKKKKGRSKALFETMNVGSPSVQSLLDQEVPDPLLARSPKAQQKLLEGLEALSKAKESFQEVKEESTSMEFLFGQPE